MHKRIYEEIAEGGQNAEPISQLKGRIASLMDDYAGKKVVMVAHGFLVRLMDSYALHDGNMTNALNNISMVQPVGYMEARNIVPPALRTKTISHDERGR